MNDLDQMRVVDEIIAGSAYATLATCDAEGPRVRPVSAFARDDGSIWIAAFSGSRKMAEIEANPCVELCFVDGRHWHVRVRGRAIIESDIEVKAALMDDELTPEMWRTHLSGPEDPRFGLIRVAPELFEWNRSGEVTYRTVVPNKIP